MQKVLLLPGLLALLAIVPAGSEAICREICNLTGSDAGDSGKSYSAETNDMSKYADIYGIRFPILEDWEKVSDRDFPMGALIFNDGLDSKEELFVSALPVGLLERDAEIILNCKIDSLRKIDGHYAEESDTLMTKENVKLIVLRFRELKSENGDLLIIAVCAASKWDLISDDLEMLLSRIKIL
jgi:hypothetical protein